MIVDEIGYRPISRTGAVPFSEVMARRYEQASTNLASNKSFEDWGEILGYEVTAAASIDRLLHHCHIVNIRGNCYRLRHHAELPVGAPSHRRQGQREIRPGGPGAPRLALTPTVQLSPAFSCNW